MGLHITRGFDKPCADKINFAEFGVFGKHDFNIMLLFFGAPLVTDERWIADDVVGIRVDVVPVDAQGVAMHDGGGMTQRDADEVGAECFAGL